MDIKYSNNEKIFTLHTDGIPYLSFDMLDRLGVTNIYTTRYLSYDRAKKEGVQGLRTALMKDDDYDEATPHTLEMRSRIAEQIGSSLDREIVTEQQHTNHVHVATVADMGPAWPNKMPLHRQYVDGVVTDIPGALLTAFGADCPEVYIADPVRKAIGLVHAGWKGTFGKIPAVAIAQMVVNFGCDPADMYAAIGPGVCRDCYEMGDEVYEAFASEWGREDADRVLSRYPADIERGWKYHLDLAEANRLTLLRAGIAEDRIAVSNVCTKCNADVFYSYRAGRQENDQCAMMVNEFR